MLCTHIPFVSSEIGSSPGKEELDTCSPPIFDTLRDVEETDNGEGSEENQIKTTLRIHDNVHGYPQNN